MGLPARGPTGLSARGSSTDGGPGDPGGTPPERDSGLRRDALGPGGGVSQRSLALHPSRP
eukprot:4620624-Alexandrium_andersonii.AAC.1